MRLAAKLTLVVVLAVALLLTSQAVLNVRKVNQLHETELLSDMTVFSDVLAAAVTLIWKSGGQKQALSYLRRIEAQTPQLTFRVVEPGRAAALPEAGLARARRHAQLPQPPHLVGENVVAQVPLDLGGDRRALLRVTRSRADQKRRISEIVDSNVVASASLVAAFAALALALGVRFVGRRVERLVTQARRIARGEFVFNDDRHRDELGRLAREVNLMARRLAEAQEEIARERVNRTELLEDLRHGDRLATVGRLASGIAHELGTPLNVVTGRATMIASGECVGPEAAQSARIIIEQGQRMTQSIRRLLAFSRRDRLERRVVRVAELMEQAAALLEPIAQSHDVSIELADPPPVEAEVDSAKVLQVLTNLMINGIQAMPAGGRLVLSLRRRQVLRPGDPQAREGPYVCIEVADEGVGITAENIEQIFEPFFTTRGSGEGSGLGLTVCQGILKEHGGWIAVESEPGRGSRFTVYLPQGGVQ